MLRAFTDRYDRMRRIGCLDMERISGCRCLVVGAGALGNETVKDLVLSGFKDITVVDHDRVSISNLSRCMFFRECDVPRRPKVDALAERVADLDPSCRITPIGSRIEDVDDYGFDLALGCLDNISARLHLNSHLCHHSVPYVDGATHGLDGKVQVVLPGGPCLQCSMNRTHVREMERHFSCSGDDRYVPPVPSDITATAVVAGMQVREALKIASGRTDLCMRDVCYYDGSEGTCEVLRIPVDDICPNHWRQ